MAVNLSPVWGAGAQLLDNSGNVLSGGKIYTYAAGTTTPQTTYTSSTGLTPNSNPIVLNSAGRVPYEVWISSSLSYKFVLKDSSDVLIGTYDNIDSVSAATIYYNEGDTGAVDRTIQSKLQETISVKDFGAVGNGSADDTTAVQNAVNAAYSKGAILNFPAGTYSTTTSITNLHNVVKTGNGVVKRGSDVFYVAISASQSNTVYVATTGSTTNDGLSASQPIQTVQKTFDVLKSYGPTLNGTWTIRLAAGTYNATAQLVGLRSLNNIIIRGPSVGGHPNVPTALIDGTGISSVAAGWYFQFYVKASIYDVKFQNWDGANVSYGLTADGHCQLSLDNCHFYKCYYAGVSCDNLTQLRMYGGIVDSCTYYGVRLYSQTSASVGYSGSVTGDSTEIKNCNVGIMARVNCRSHVDYCNIHDCGTGIVSEYNTRTVVNYTKTENCSIGWQSTLGSNIQTSVDGANSMTGTAKGYVCFSSILSSTTANECNYYNYWDEGTKRFLYGSTSYRTPVCKYEWQLSDTRSGSGINSNVKAFFDSSSNTLIGIGAGSSGYAGFSWSNPSTSSEAYFLYSHGSRRFGMNLAGADAYQWTSTQFVPLTDNNKTLGNGSYRWSVVYAGTGTINTSDANEKQQVRPLDYKEKAVALAIKARIKAFKFNDAVAEKGEEARIHFGVMAQDVKEAFEAESLDASKYGVFCSDVMENGETRLGVRYDELFAFIIGAI